LCGDRGRLKNDRKRRCDKDRKRTSSHGCDVDWWSRQLPPGLNSRGPIAQRAEVTATNLARRSAIQQVRISDQSAATEGPAARCARAPPTSGQQLAVANPKAPLIDARDARPAAATEAGLRGLRWGARCEAIGRVRCHAIPSEQPSVVTLRRRASCLHNWPRKPGVRTPSNRAGQEEGVGLRALSHSLVLCRMARARRRGRTSSLATVELHADRIRYQLPCV